MKEGNKEVIGEIIRRHGSDFKLYFRRRLKRDATDVYQEFWIKFPKMIQGQPLEDWEVAQIKAWMNRVAYHMLIDIWRKRQRAPQFVDDTILEGLTAPTETPSRVLSRRESIAELQGAMTPIDWAIIKMKNEGRTSKEIGRILGLSVEAVDTRYHRSKKYLREKFGENL
ncbi:MAG: RNA polymerase sigma factor [Isosphaeraceae bacterium]